MTSYWTDDKLEALALSVIGESRELSLNGVTMNFPRIAYLHCDTVKKSGGLFVHADTEKVSDKNKAIMKKDFIITFYLKVDENGRSWKELAVFNYDILDKRYSHQTPAMQILMFKQEQKWLGVCLIAALLVSLYRNFDFDQDELLRLMNDVAEIEMEYNLDGKRLEDDGKKLTGVAIFKE